MGCFAFIFAHLYNYILIDNALLGLREIFAQESFDVQTERYGLKENLQY